MQLKRSMDLTPYDIPRTESPFLAAAEVGGLISSGRLSDIDLPRLLRIRPDNRESLATLATRQVADGDLFLIHGPFDPGPLSPVIDWRDNPKLPAGGEWRPSSPLPFGLGYALQELNNRQLTPDDVKRGRVPGAGPAPAAKKPAPERAPSGTATPAASVIATTMAGMKLAEELNPDTSKEQKPEIHVEVGIFTDGTLNNAFNSQQMEEVFEQECLLPFENNQIDQAECERRLGLLMGASYANAPSNVAKLFNLYPEDEVYKDNAKTIRVKGYAPGPGSKTGSDDSLFGAATGLGDTGVINQVKQAYREISSQLPIRLKGAQITSMSVDVFGFSRGAAAARHAVHDINLGSEGLFSKSLTQAGVDLPENLEVRFVGLFDCVAAIVNPMMGDLRANNNKNDPVEIFLDAERVRHAVHLTANHEHRKLFALNSLKYPDGNLPTNFREISLPGAHSDIGGGYPESQREEVLVSPLYPIPRNRQKWPERTVQWDNLDPIREMLRAEGWVGDYSLPVRNGSVDDSGRENTASVDIIRKYRAHPSPDGVTEIAVRMVRQIKADYSKIILGIMHELASQSQVPFEALGKQDPTLRIPDELRTVQQSLHSQISNGTEQPALSNEDMSLILQRYIHYSAHYNGFEALFAGRPATLHLFRNIRPNAPSPARERIIHPNLERV